MIQVRTGIVVRDKLGGYWKTRLLKVFRVDGKNFRFRFLRYTRSHCSRGKH